jgi:hypothetical protein
MLFSKSEADMTRMSLTAELAQQRNYWIDTIHEATAGLRAMKARIWSE